MQETQDTWVWSLGREDPWEEEIATHSSILVWGILMDQGAWQGTVHRVAKRGTRLKRLSMHAWREMPSPKGQRLTVVNPCVRLPGSLPARRKEVKVTEWEPLSCVRLFVTPRTVQPARLLCAWDSPGRNTRVGCHSLLQRVFPTRGLNPGLLHFRQILYPLSHL